jgi:alkanesulfonate monooxygenase SsuD/methylene tetrahydromethanopterin reductase-like flavin-dependent oxidoreductase (luciferase family)
MEIAIGAPNAVPWTSGENLVEFARRADAAGFSMLSTIDRLAYPNYESLITLAAAAAVTERIKLATTIAITPYRLNTALFAKQAASVQRISNGRLVLGIAAGGRENDYTVSGADFGSRNRRFEEAVDEISGFWAGSGNASGDPSSQAVGPDVSSKPPLLLLGGYTPATFRRVAQHADGYVLGGGSPDQMADAREGVEAAWQEIGRDGTPYIGALTYYSLGDEAEEHARNYLGDYYTWLGEETANIIVDNAAKDAETVKAYVQAFEQAGCQELVFFPSHDGPEQVDLLAEAVL